MAVSVNIGDVLATLIMLIFIILLMAFFFLVIKQLTASIKEKNKINQKLDEILEKQEEQNKK